MPNKPRVDELKCFQCKNKCQCDCLMIDIDIGCAYFCSLGCYETSDKKYDWDAEFGEYNGHYAECRLGGQYEKKWKDVMRNLNIWRDLANDRHSKWIKLKQLLATKELSATKKAYEEILTVLKKNGEWQVFRSSPIFAKSDIYVGMKQLLESKLKEVEDGTD